LKRNTGRPRQAHGKKKEWGGRCEQLPNRLRRMPGPSVEQRLTPDERMEITANFTPAVEDCADADRQNPTFCPRCAILGQRVLMSGTHFKRADGTVVSEFGCACGHAKLVKYSAR
jgi:hypothetical protein